MSEEKQKKDLKELYHDSTQTSVQELQHAADAAAAEARERGVDVVDVVRDILLFFGTVALAFAWMMLMLLLISFVFHSYWHIFKIEWMVGVSIAFAVAAAIRYLWKMYHKYDPFWKKGRR